MKQKNKNFFISSRVKVTTTKNVKKLPKNYIIHLIMGLIKALIGDMNVKSFQTHFSGLLRDLGLEGVL